jgi:hypothetical protein
MLATSGRGVAASRRGTIMSCRKQRRTTDEKNMSEKDFYKTGLDSAATRSVQRYFYGSNSIEIKIVIYPAGKSRFDYKCDKSRVKERKMNLFYSTDEVY